MVIRALAPGTTVKLRQPGPLERGEWRIIRPLWHPQSGLAYELAHGLRGNFRIIPAARVRVRAVRRRRQP